MQIKMVSWNNDNKSNLINVSCLTNITNLSV